MSVSETRQSPCPSPLINIPSDSSQVLDADEEIADLYMNLAGLPSETGLGYMDTSKAVLELEMEIRPLLENVKSDDAPSSPTGRRSRKTRPVKGSGRSADRTMVVPVTVHQDLAMLKGRKGDTGSVLWRSSWYLAQHLLTQYHYPPPDTSHALLDRDQLSRARVLELGSGTGMLAVLLSEACGTYTATDLYENLRLVSRNVELNQRLHGRPSKSKEVKLEELDWIAISKDSTKVSSRTGREEGGGYDLVIAVDCIYNEYLVRPFIDTLSAVCPQSSSTVVLVVVELRSADVLTAFLEEWLRSGTWEIVRLPSESLGLWAGHPGRWVGWVGWRE